VLGGESGASGKYLTFCMAIIGMGLQRVAICKYAGNGMIRESRGLMVAVLVHT
jgi:hypothetical protein